MAKKGRQEIADELAALLHGLATGTSVPIPPNQVSEDSDSEGDESSDAIPANQASAEDSKLEEYE